ncbi:MAG: glycoside hydrolase family 3 C-terminal domain-containing protein [Bacteroidaceae bacterium]|nr:glycoside hydrolase family 3 C-terminal domain-containing protein [Bacteroidaceae bacterium]
MNLKRNLLALSMMALISCPVTTFAKTRAHSSQKEDAVQYPFQDPKLSIEKRADDLLSRLTLDEKVSLMMHQSKAVERLGVPSFQWWNEALHGVGRNGKATVFPITMAMAASFDEALLEQVYTAVSDEARAKNQQAKQSGRVRQYQDLSFWTPNVNIFRDPRWGRGQETYGEDPYLTSRMGVAVVKGLQGPDDAKYRKTLACAKHFAVHSGPEWNRHSFNVTDLPLRDLWETYMPAFKALIQEANVEEVMCAYQRIDDEPCCGNNRYLKQILRNDLGFKGLVTSDCWAISDFWKKGNHEVVETKSEASAMAVRAGTDLECGSDYNSLPEAVQAGIVTEKEINESLRRLLIARFKLGDFDDDSLVPWTKIPESTICSSEHRALSRKMAQEGIVLLQNRNQILPLAKSGKKIVVMGPNANDSTMLLGNYNGFPMYAVTVLEGILAKRSDVKFVDGCRYVDAPANQPQRRQRDRVNLNANPFGNMGMQADSVNTLANPAATTARASEVANARVSDEELLASASDADIVIFVGGISPRLEGEEMRVNFDGFRGGDRTSIELPEAQRRILKALHEKGKRIVYVNCSGSAMALMPEAQYCDAIIQAWYGGEEGGNALADVLFGDVNPSGKLPVTFYRSTDQLPDYEDYKMSGRTYRFMNEAPLFPFGFGLSYTSFAYSNIQYKKGSITLSLTNNGKRDGEEVVQVYLRKVGDNEGPKKTLRAYKRVAVKAGQTAKVTIPFGKEHFEWWDAASNTMRILPGQYELMVGTDSNAKVVQTIKM